MKAKTSELEGLANREIENSPTGEVHVHFGNKKFRPREGYYMCFGTSMLIAVKKAKENKTPLTVADYEVMYAYLSHMQYGNQISIAQQDIADQLGVQRQVATRSAAHLVNAGIFGRKGEIALRKFRVFQQGKFVEAPPARRRVDAALRGFGRSGSDTRAAIFRCRCRCRCRIVTTCCNNITT